MGHKSRDLTLRICHLPTLGESLNGSALIYKMRAGVTALCVWLGGNTDLLVNVEWSTSWTARCRTLKEVALSSPAPPGWMQGSYYCSRSGKGPAFKTEGLASQRAPQSQTNRAGWWSYDSDGKSDLKFDPSLAPKSLTHPACTSLCGARK